MFALILKAFTMQGFKSFPDKTALTFDKGVSAVVGPNGSGKSNIAEAMRWVLGEQNARALRCEKRMEEIIFHGTSRRDPLGFAEATLALDNTKGGFPLPVSDIAITRRLYRSGESEYYINKTLVRLKDVLDLFMDTGLGRDGYSIIGQGRIAEIISDRGGDRRRVFEEAAGISKTRHRKEEAERKLKLAQDNLLRVGDKIEELELQVGPLRKQAEVARTFLTLREELKGWEVDLFCDTLHKIKLNYEKVRDDWQTADTQLAAGLVRLDTLYAQSEDLGEKMRVLTTQTEALYEDMSALEKKTGLAGNEISVLQTSLHNNRDYKQRLITEMAQFEDRNESLAVQMRERADRRADLSARMEALDRDLSACQQQWDMLSAQAMGDEKELFSLKEREETAKNALLINELRAQEETQAQGMLREQKAEMEQTLEAAREAAVISGQEAAACEEQWREAGRQLSSLQNMLDGYEMRRQARQTKADTLHQKRQAVQAEKNNKTNRYQLLSDMEREYEGRSRAVKTVMQEKTSGRLRGVHGAVSDLLSVPERLAIAVEIALGGAVHNIVVEDEECGRDAIALLKQRDAGRATFLPLTAMRGRVIDEPLDGVPGYVGIASALCRTERRYEGIINHLLGYTLVMESMDSAIAMGRRTRHRYRIVTLDGQLLLPGGAMTGGSVGKSIGIFTRKNEMIRLRTEIDALGATLAELDQAAAQADRELTAVLYDCEVAQGERRTAEDALLTLGKEWEHKKQWWQEDQKKIGQLQLELQKTGQAYEEKTKRLAALTEERTQLAEQAAQLAQAIGAKQGGHVSAVAQTSVLSETMSGLRAQRAAVQAEGQAEARAYAELEQLKVDLSGDQTEKERFLLDIDAKNKAFEVEIAEKESEMAFLHVQAEAMQARVKEALETRTHWEGERLRFDRQAREQNEENNRLEREKARLESRKALGESEEKQIIDKLWDNYEITRSLAQEMARPVDNLSKLSRRIGELKSQIAALGSPNIAAIDEYARVSERYEYLSSQRDDAVAAKEELVSIIDGIVGEMKHIFSEQFSLINTTFSSTFKEIFGGGDAHLELEDPQSILECGVEIKAQPPGKKMRSISLLSGGEKSLVAIALYFSIFKVRPAPFCILDEVDHDLDDLNVLRFATYLHRLSDQIQFVIITHRRGTMEQADQLYGVMAQEEGVSKVLSMKMADIEAAMGQNLN